MIAAGLFACASWVLPLNLFAAPIVTWVQDRADANQWIVQVSGLSAPAIEALRRAEWNTAQWQQLLTVRTEQETLIGDIGMPPMIGKYSLEKESIRFLPAFPLEAGLRYRASLYPDKLPGGREADRSITAVVKIPARATEPTTVVKQIYPSASLLPENLLKFYVHFSAPMARGHIYEHIHLRDEAGLAVELPFLEIDEELWDPTMTRLTLFIDPGRIKRGVTPLEEVGPALQMGRRYSLVIERDWKDAAGTPLQKSFEKRFQVGPVDREPVDPARWKIQSPRDSSGSLVVSFPEPMDHALAQRVIRVADAANHPIFGTVSLENEERRWKFVPLKPWRTGRHHLLIQKTIEDLAGNNIGKSFEVDLFDHVQQQFTNSTIQLLFEIR